MKDILKYKKDLKEITFGGNVKDVYIDYDLEIPEKASKLYNQFLTTISKYLFDLTDDKYKWFFQLYEPYYYLDRVYIELLEESETESVFRENLKKYISIAGGYISDLAIKKELGINHISKDLDILIPNKLVAFFVVAKIIKENKSVENFEEVEVLYERTLWDDNNEMKNKGLEILVRTIMKNGFLRNDDSRYVETIMKEDDYLDKTESIYLFVDDCVININSTEYSVTEHEISRFDFSFRKFYYNGEKVITTKGALYDIKNKKLHLNELNFALNSLFKGFEYRDAYNFEFSDIDKKMLFYKFVRNERGKIYLRPFIKNGPIKKEEVLNYVEELIDKFPSDTEEEINEYEVLEFVLRTVKEGEYNNDDLIKEILYKRISLNKKYKEKYKKDIYNLIEWVLTLGIIGTSISNESTEIATEEKIILSALMREYNEKTIYYSKIKEYYLENKLYSLTYWEKKIKVNPLGIPEYIFNYPEFKIENKVYSRNKLIDLRKKMELIKRFDEKNKNYNYNEMLDLYKKVGINIKDEKRDLLKLKKREKFVKLNLILDILMFIHLIEINSLDSKNIIDIDKFIEKTISDKHFIKSFFIDNVTVSYDLFLSEFIDEDEIRYNVYFDKDGERIKDGLLLSHFIISEKEKLETKFIINHPIYKSISDGSLDNYMKEFNYIIEEKIKEHILSKINYK